jgi:hypothetical protein
MQISEYYRRNGVTYPEPQWPITLTAVPYYYQTPMQTRCPCEAGGLLLHVDSSDVVWQMARDGAHLRC